MKELKQFLFENLILEGVYKDIPGSEEECREYFNNNLIKGENIPTEIINKLFSIWKEIFNSSPSKIPFRCDGKHAKLSRIYQSYIDELEDICRSLNIKFNSYIDRIKINDVVITWGEGSIRGNRAEKGLSYEDEIVSQLIQIVELIARRHKEKPMSEKEFKETVENPMLAEWWDFYNGGALNEVINLYPDCDLSKIIIKTGSGNTHRNDNGELFSDDFEITSSDIEKVLKESGNIIADVTIDTKNPVYISVKMKASQLSGVSYRKAIVKNETFKAAVQSSKTYDDIKDTKDMIPFNNFCSVLGLYPEDVYNKYKNIYSGNTSNMLLELNKNNKNSKLIGTLFQKLLGGNYWYVKPGIQKYVDYKNANLEFNATDARISESGKTITISGVIKGIKSEILFRTDSEKYGPWPYRLFPKISVPELIEKV